MYISWLLIHVSMWGQRGWCRLGHFGFNTLSLVYHAGLKPWTLTVWSLGSPTDWANKNNSVYSGLFISSINNVWRRPWVYRRPWVHNPLCLRRCTSICPCLTTPWIKKEREEWNRNRHLPLHFPFLIHRVERGGTEQTPPSPSGTGGTHLSWPHGKASPEITPGLA